MKKFLVLAAILAMMLAGCDQPDNNSTKLPTLTIINSSSYKSIPAENNSQTGDFSVSLLNVGILARYPFYLNKITLFPAIGADYQLWLFATENETKTHGDLSANNSIRIKAGGGIDYAINSQFFIRGELLWGLKLNSKNENKDPFSYFTHGPMVNVGIGYVVN